MQKSGFQRLLRRTIAIPIVLLVLLAVTLVVEVLSLTSNLRWVDHSDRVIAASRQAMRNMVEMESALRGYDLTRDQNFLEPFQKAKAQLPASIDNLVQLTADNQLQQNRLKDIRDLDKGWIQWAEQEIAAHSPKKPSEDELMFGARLMDEIRNRQREVVAEEERILRTRSQRAKVLGRIVLGTSVGLSLLVALLLFTLTRRELRALDDTYERQLQAEAERTRQLQESREWFQTTLNSLGEGVVATDDKGHVMYINPVAEKLTGWGGPLDPRGRKLGEVLRMVDERNRIELRQQFEVFAHPEKDGGLPLHVAIIDRNGREFPAEINAAPILNVRHELAGIVVVFRDITQRRQTEQTLRASERLAQAGRLSATIAHEIRNPLDTVTNLIYLLQHEDHPGLVTRQYLDMASDELMRITQITGQLLTFHREARNPVQVSVNEVLESVLTLFAPQIRKVGITVDKRFESGGRIRGFPGELRQVFSNLVSNSIDAMPHGGKLILRVRQSTLAGDSSRRGVRVTVLDSGSGIAPGVKRNLFAPFFTTKGEKGTGLGLWVSRGIIEKHEGTIHLISSARAGREGTAFSVFLPFEQVLGKLDVVRAVHA